MKKCNKCNVKVNSEGSICPLCGADLEKIDSIKEENTYPKIEHMLKKYRELFKYFGIISIVISICSIIANVITYNGVKWSLIVTAGMLYWWISIAYLVRKNVSVSFKIVIQTILLDLLAICADLGLGYTGIAINYVIPMLTIVANLIIISIVILNRTNWKKYLMYQLGLFIIGILPLICIPFGLIYTYSPIITSTAVTIAMFLSTMVHRNADLKEEYIRRFHI